MIDTATLPMVAYGEMNDVHLEEVILLNELEKVIDVKDYEATLEKLEALLEHTKAHFERENNNMRECSFPAYDMHKGEHDKVLRELDYNILEFRNRKNFEAIKSYICEETPAWLNQHIASMDVVTCSAFGASMTL